MDLLTPLKNTVIAIEHDYPVYNRGVSKTKVYKAVGDKVRVTWKAKAKVADFSARNEALWDIVCIEMSRHGGIPGWANKIGMSTSCRRDSNPDYIEYEICFRDKC